MTDTTFHLIIGAIFALLFLLIIAILMIALENSKKEARLWHDTLKVVVEQRDENERELNELRRRVSDSEKFKQEDPMDGSGKG